MEIMEFGEITPVNVRKIWANDATDFTPWLASNINKLGQVLGMELEVQDREADVGDFSLDLLAKDLGSGRTVIIENQLKETDHDHLGKLLTYAGGFSAGVLVWISTSLRDEHRKALEWLNETTGEGVDFFGVVIEAIRIDNSKPAINFKLVVFPNIWPPKQPPPHSPKATAYKEYFQQLIDELRIKHKFTGAKAGQPQSWYSFSSGIAGIVFSNSFALGGKVRAEVYIDFQNQEKNKAFFDALHEIKDQIDGEYGEPLSWERMDDKRASRIAAYCDGTIDVPPVQLQEIKKWSIDNLLRFKKILLPKIKQVLESKAKEITEPVNAADRP